MHRAFIRKHQLNSATFDSSQCDNLNICCNACVTFVPEIPLKINFPRLSWLEKIPKISSWRKYPFILYIVIIVLSQCKHAKCALWDTTVYIVIIMFSKMRTCKKYMIKLHLLPSYLGYLLNIPIQALHGTDCDSIQIINFIALMAGQPNIGHAGFRWQKYLHVHCT